MTQASKFSLTLPLSIAIAFTFSVPAQASLTSYTANGVDLVRMKDNKFDVSWTKDGNLFQTLASSYAGGATAFINAVIASSGGGIYNHPNTFDTPANSGYHNLSASDFNTTNGTVSWFGARAYVNYLNSIKYGGNFGWRLPDVRDVHAFGTPAYDGCNFAYSGTDCGYNVINDTSALAQLYFGELNKKSQFNASGQPQSGYGIFGNNGIQVAGGVVGPFNNVQSSGYWSDSDYIPANGAWDFNFSDGNQDGSYKNLQFYAWAITSGQVATVPVPGAVWLFGTGLVGLVSLKRRNQAT